MVADSTPVTTNADYKIEPKGVLQSRAFEGLIKVIHR